MHARSSDILLGLVFFGSLIGLGVATIALSDVRFGTPQHDVDLYSDDVGYLRPGDPVLLDGMPTGKVRAIERLDPPRTLERLDGTPVECAVVVRARVDADVRARLSTAGRIVVEDRGLLGGKLVRIDAAPGGEPLPPDAPLVAELSVSALQATGEILEENREDLRRTIDNLATASGRIASGEGLLGALISDPKLAEDFRSIVAQVLGTVEDARESSPVQGAGSLLFGTF